MRKIPAVRVKPILQFDSVRISMFFLAGCFLLGGILGQWYAAGCGSETHSALQSYLTDYCLCMDQMDACVPVGRCFLLYLVPVCAAFLFGFSSIGSLFIPVFALGFGFVSFFTTSCFVNSFPEYGCILALALTSVRLVFTLPCFLAVAGEALALSLRYALLAVGRGKRAGTVSAGGWYLFIFVVCLLILCVGVLCERLLTPILFRAVIERFAITF